jgi:hypothetical protein
MCGGVRFPYNDSFEETLAAIYLPAQIDQFRSSGVIEALFWQPRPILPVVLNGEVQLLDWGNRDQTVNLPKTGWVRHESLEAGKWNYLKPEPVVLPVLAGVEKNQWFGITHGIHGLLVHHQNLKRIYMVTVPPTEAFRARTRHDRMPALIEQIEADFFESGPHQQQLGF